VFKDLLKHGQMISRRRRRLRWRWGAGSTLGGLPRSWSTTLASLGLFIRADLAGMHVEINTAAIDLVLKQHPRPIASHG
jgi:hypothetical protein